MFSLDILGRYQQILKFLANCTNLQLEIIPHKIRHQAIYDYDYYYFSFYCRVYTHMKRAKEQNRGTRNKIQDV